MARGRASGNLTNFRARAISGAVAGAGWGLLGAHKLYLGRPVMAALYFFTGGFFMVGWALDLLTRSAGDLSLPNVHPVEPDG